MVNNIKHHTDESTVTEYYLSFTTFTKGTVMSSEIEMETEISCILMINRFCTYKVAAECM